MLGGRPAPGLEPPSTTAQVSCPSRWACSRPGPCGPFENRPQAPSDRSHGAPTGDPSAPGQGGGGGRPFCACDPADRRAGEQVATGSLTARLTFRPHNRDIFLVMNFAELRRPARPAPIQVRGRARLPGARHHHPGPRAGSRGFRRTSQVSSSAEAGCQDHGVGGRLCVEGRPGIAGNLGAPRVRATVPNPCLCRHTASPCACVRISLLRGHWAVPQGRPTPRPPHRNPIPSPKTLFPNKVAFAELEVRMWTHVLGAVM